MGLFSNIIGVMNSLLTIALFIAFSTQAFAHGENAPGPHGGHIRMPGAYHTEVVVMGKTEFKVYLLDVNWKNPTIDSSSVKGVFVGEAKRVAFNCRPNGDYFHCTVPRNVDLQTGGELRIRAMRQTLAGVLAVYKLPLTFSAETRHEGHQNTH